MLRVVTQGIWTFGASSLAEFVEMSKQYTIEDVVGQIQCPCLIMEADGDIFFKGRPKRVYDALKAPKQFVRFGSEDGAENHCQSGALAYKDQVIFDWLDETLKLHDGRKSSYRRFFGRHRVKFGLAFDGGTGLDSIY